MNANGRIGLVLVGLGANGRARLANLHKWPWVELKAVCDVREDFVRAVAGEHKVFGSTSLEECLKQPGIDAVHCSTANAGHAPVTIAALKAGKHVFCEKPMATTRQDAQAMLAAERESGKHLQINFELRGSRAPLRLHEIVESGAIGKLNSAVFMHCRGGWGPVGGFRLDPELSGGAVLECPIHHIDELRWLGGDFRSVQVFRNPSVLPGYPQKIADNFTAMLEWETGLWATMVVMHGRSANVLPLPGSYEYADAWTARGHEQSLTVIGTEGSLVYDNWRTRLLVFRYNHDSKEVEFVREENYQHYPQGVLDHDTTSHAGEFYRRLLDGRPPVQSAEDAWRSTATAMAAEESIMNNCIKVPVKY